MHTLHLQMEQADVNVTAGPTPSPSKRTLRGLDWLNFFLADVQTGVGPFLAIFLGESKWNPQSVGIALAVGGIAGIITQTPLGALVDRTKHKRTLIVAGVIALAIGALMIALWPKFWPVLIAQSLIGGVSSVFIPAVVAISLGLVGHKLFDCRQGRNQTFNSAGNVFAALGMGAIGYYMSNRDIFFFVGAMVLPTLLCLGLINSTEINHQLARGSVDGNKKKNEKPATIWELLRDHRLSIFLACCVIFHFANAAMLPLLGEMLSKGKGKSSMMFMSACVVTTQAVVAFIASPSSRLAMRWGRKPLLLIGFAALPLRGFLYTLTSKTTLLVAIQALDGIGAGIFGVVSVLVIADLTRGTGRFNLAQGAIATAVGIGASLSQAISGAVVHHLGFHAGFIFLALIAVAGFLLLWLAMPETADFKQQAVHPDSAASVGE